MLLILLLISQVTGEWVEISQQHYTHRKPLRPHSSLFIEEATTNRYINHSVTEFNWNQGVYRVPNVGNVKRVQLVDNLIKTSPVEFNSRTQVIKSSTDITGEETPVPVKGSGIVQRIPSEKRVAGTTVKSMNDIFKPYVGTRNNAPNINTRNNFTEAIEPVDEFKSDDKVLGTIHRVPNIGNVKRVQLANTPVKSPSLKVKPEPTVKSPSLDDEVFLSNYKYKGDVRNKPEFATTEDIESDEDFEMDPNIDYPKTKVDDRMNFNNVRKSNKNIIGSKRPIIHNSERKIFDNYTLIPNIPTSEFISGEGPTETIYLPTEINSAVGGVTQQTIRRHEYSPIEIHHNAFGIKEKSVTKLEKPPSNNNRQGTNRKPFGDLNNKENEESQSHEHNDDDTVKDNEGVKVNTIENVLKFIKVVANTISSNTRRGVGGKMRYLQELKHTILASIEDRIESMWPDDVHHTSDSAARRRSRSTHATARGHVEFPSSEGALMTISFLTFAVFLIKLVLQVIHTYKNKTMMVAPLVVASAGRAAFNNRDRKRN